MTTIIFTMDARNNVGHPTRRVGWINKKLRDGTAKKLKQYTNVIQVQLLDKKFNTQETVDCEFRIGIDPGYQHIGFCMYKIYNNKITKLFSGEVTTRTEEIKRLLSERKMYRKARRRCRRENVKRKFGARKFRHPRWKNRRDKLDWNPTLRHLIEVHCNLMNKITNLVGLNQMKVHVEYSTFDIHKLVNPGVRSFWYQLGPKYGYQNSKLYSKKRDGYYCQVCKSRDIPNLTIHHIVQQIDGGTDRPDNLVTVCRKCHDKIHAGKIKLSSNYKPKIFRDTGVLNSCMKKIFETFEDVIPTQNTYGYITDVMRKSQDLEKTHSLDASIIALCDPLGFQEEFNDYDFEDLKNELEFVQKRRHVRTHTTRLEDRKYYHDDYIVAKNRRRRETQKDDSLEDFRKDFPRLQMTVKPGVKRPRISNTKVLFKPGDKVLYNNQICTCYGWGSTHGEVGLIEVGSYVKTRLSKVLAKNSGLVCLH
jgi:hypothetical protein